MTKLKRIKRLLDIEMGVDISKKTRVRHFVIGRKIYCKLAHQTVPASTSQIGAAIGIDHATVLHHVRDKGYSLNEDEKKVYNKILTIVTKNTALEKSAIDKMEMEDFVIKINHLMQQVNDLHEANKNLKSKLQKSEFDHQTNGMDFRQKKLNEVFAQMTDKGKKDLLDKAFLILKMNTRDAVVS